MFEFWLKNEDENAELMLPVSPASYEDDNSMEIETVRTTNVGDINISTHKKLSTMTLKSFFPGQDYDFAKKVMEPMEYANKIKGWIDKKSVIRLVITDGATSKVNRTYLIESIILSETDETNGDLDYSLTLREFRKIEVSKVVEIKTVGESVPRGTVKSTLNVNSYTVVSGDSLSRIARKVYGNAAKWPSIYAANKTLIKNPNIIYVGQVLVIPK